MKLHGNARTCPKSRRLLVDRLEGEWSLREAAEAERLAIEFSEDFRLLNDIGWDAGDRRESFELTMPVHDLTETLKRLQGEAEAVLRESPAERRSREEDEETNSSFRLGLDACEKLLVDLDEWGGWMAAPGEKPMLFPGPELS